MAKITIHCAAREYYTGSDTYELPLGLTEEHIDNVQPDGYGEVMIFLTNEADPIIEAQEFEFTDDLYWRTLTSAVHNDWYIVKFTNQYAIKWRGEMHMEFCEVDENFVDHWEIEEDD